MNATVSEFLAFYAPTHQEEGDVTLKDAMLAWNVGALLARKKLDAIVLEGKLKLVEDAILSSGKKGRLWRPVKKGKT